MELNREWHFEAGIDPEDVIGLGIDFTACTMLPVKADGTPLATLAEYRENPHAWIKLYAEYLCLHDYFGRGENNVMKTLKRIKAETRRSSR